MWNYFRQFYEKRKTKTDYCFKATRNLSQQESRHKEDLCDYCHNVLSKRKFFGVSRNRPS